MSSPQYIYNLIAMSQSYIDAWERRRVKEEEYNKATVGMDRGQRIAFNIKWQEQNPPSFDPETSIGKSYRGTFGDLDALIEIIESQDDPYGLCECYYTYMLIERYEINRIDDTCWGEDGEIWYKMDENYRYNRIDKPKCFERTFNFT